MKYITDHMGTQLLICDCEINTCYLLENASYGDAVSYISTFNGILIIDNTNAQFILL